MAGARPSTAIMPLSSKRFRVMREAGHRLAQWPTSERKKRMTKR